MNTPGAQGGNSGWVEEGTVSDECKETDLRAAHTRPVNGTHAGAYEMKETYWQSIKQ